MENIIIFICILLIPCCAYSVISYNYSKYKESSLKGKISGFEVARKILDDNDLKDMYIVEIKGNLNDHYDFNQKVIRLSTDVYHGENITSAVVASRVCEYAIQDKVDNKLFKIGATLNPIIKFDVYAAYILFIIGLCLQDFGIVKVSSLLMGLALIYRVATLPVEFTIMKNAKSILSKLGILNKKEIEEGEVVFKVSVYTYIMEILTSVTSLFNEIIYNLQRKG